MSLADHYHKEVRTIRADATVEDAALAMANAGVGCLVVVGASGEPVGLVTDRDLVVRAVAEGLVPTETSVAAVMSSPLVHAAPSDSIDALVALMESFGIRRIPILEDGRVVGLVSLDDVLVDVSIDLWELGAAAHGEYVQARWHAQVEGLLTQLEERFDEAVHWLGGASLQARESMDEALRQIRERLRRTGERLLRRDSGGDA